MLKRIYLTSDKTNMTNSVRSPRTNLLFALFMIGCLLGAFFGSSYSSVNIFGLNLFETASADGNVFAQAFNFIRFHLFAILLGTSFLGILFVPALTLLKGFALSCASATIILSQPSGGIVMALIILGIPSIFSIPCFIAISDDALDRSIRLFSLLRGNYSAPLEKNGKKWLFILPAMIISVAVEMKLVPYLLTLLR